MESVNDQGFAFFGKAILYAVKRIVTHAPYSFAKISRAGATTGSGAFFGCRFSAALLQPILSLKGISRNYSTRS
jgi:hypothetical protein